MIAFLLSLGLLLVEGWLVAGLLHMRGWVRYAVCLPIASLCNTLLIVVYTAVALPLGMLSFWLGHGIVIVGLLCWFMMTRRHRMMMDVTSELPAGNRIFAVIGGTLLAVVAVYAIVHAVVLPSFQMDSFTNWSMRSEVSFYDRAIAFDPTEERGVAKPQYPFLYHGMQILANTGQSEWNDRFTNTMILLLSMSMYGALFAMLRLLRGGRIALLVTAVIAATPLLAVHTSQAFGDLLLMQFLLVSLAALMVQRNDTPGHWLLLSALLTAAGAWTKLEGLYIGLIPWLLLTALLFFRSAYHRRQCVFAWIAAAILTLPFPILLLVKGLRLTPHGTDTAFGFQRAGWNAFWHAVTRGGSFGVAWYAIAFSIGCITWAKNRRREFLDLSMLPTLLWGVYAFATIFLIYVFTPNVQFLLNEEAFYRQMFVPLSLCALSIMVIFTPRHSPPPRIASTTDSDARPAA